MIDIDKKEFKSLYKLLTASELAERLGCCASTVYKIAKDLKVARKKRGRKRKVKII
jgi:predicted DNA-binding transcriptional regulator AlpA